MKCGFDTHHYLLIIFSLTLPGNHLIYFPNWEDNHEAQQEENYGFCPFYKIIAQLSHPNETQL
jgi:hypothetical protein